MTSSWSRVLGVFCLLVAATALGEPASAATPGAVAAPDPAVIHLTQQRCDDFLLERKAQAEAEVQKMREAVAQELTRWRNHQPECWQEYRENAEFWRQMSSSSNAFAFGGLGLTGVGEGGGGRGEGVALGSAQFGSGQGFGLGYGRLSGSHKTQAGQVRTSRTNVQVEGVDEADIVKTDGNFVYFAVNRALRIARTHPPQLVSVTPLEGRVREMYLEGDRVVMYVARGGRHTESCTYGYDCEVRGDGSRTQVVVLDVTSRTRPRIRRSIELSGALVGSRRIGSTVHTVVVDGDPPAAYVSSWPDALPQCGVYENAVRARLARLAIENERAIRASYTLPSLTENGKSRTFCDVLLKDARSSSRAFVSLYSFDLKRDDAKVIGASIQSAPGTVYASEGALYLAIRDSNHRLGPAETSTVHKFQIGSRPEQTQYLASGTVRGRALNQFALDAWQGNLRIATTTGQLPDPNVENQLTVLTQQGDRLVELGTVKHLAPGEDIRSVRYAGARAYIVTFKKTDPLFVLDLSKATAPALLGELKIPGFSTYLHPIDAGHLLSIGFDTDDQGDFAYFNGLLLQLFDVSEPTAPKLLHRERIGTRGSSSEAATNHLAFNFLADEGLLAIPSSTCEGGGQGRFGNKLTFAGLLIYDVSLDHGFHLRGGISHGSVGASCDTWWSRSTSAVKRSLFLDEQVWSIATDRVKVQKLSALGRDLAAIRLN